MTTTTTTVVDRFLERGPEAVAQLGPAAHAG